MFTSTEIMSGSPVLILPLLTGLAAAVFFDCRSQRIPNALVLVILLAGLASRLIDGGAASIPDALGGFAIGLVALLPFWLLGGFGAGDVKLMAAAGVWLGITGTLTAVGITLLVGGALGLLIFAWTLLFRMQLSAGAAIASLLVSPRQLLRSLKGLHFPYAIAVATGVASALFWRPL